MDEIDYVSRRQTPAHRKKIAAAKRGKRRVMNRNHPTGRVAPAGPWVMHSLRLSPAVSKRVLALAVHHNRSISHQVSELIEAALGRAEVALKVKL